jgi:GDPmannose 4,6-dehydratase
MLQQEVPEDYVVATGEQFSVRHFVTLAAEKLEMNLVWSGSGLDEVGKVDGKIIVKIDPRYFRPTEVETLLGDPSKAKMLLGWEPEFTFDQLVTEMVQEDLKLAKRNIALKEYESKF